MLSPLKCNVTDKRQAKKKNISLGTAARWNGGLLGLFRGNRSSSLSRCLFFLFNLAWRSFVNRRHISAYKNKREKEGVGNITKSNRNVHYAGAMRTRVLATGAFFW